MKSIYTVHNSKRVILMFWISLITIAVNGQSNFEAVHGFEPHFVLPPGTTVKNIKTDYGAKGDGFTDDTPAFKAWLAAKERTLYVPEGTYIIKEQLRLVLGMKRVVIMGESRSKTILRLDSNAVGFNDPASPKEFIFMRADGQQEEQNFANYIYHLTIEIGKKNPGAIALNYHTNNTGQVKDVTIRAEDPVNHPGLKGIAFDKKWFGPGGARYITIDGFKEGILIGDAKNHTVIEYAEVKNCAVGLKNLGNSCSIRKLKTEGCDTAVINKGDGSMVLLESDLLSGKGGDGLYNESEILVKKLHTTGYNKAIRSISSKGDQAGPDVTHYTGTDVIYSWQPEPGMDTTLGLPIEDSPEFQYPQTSADWAVLPTSGDISAALQSAIDAGKSTIYIQGGYLSATIYLRNNVQRIMGLGVKLTTHNTGTAPVFKLEDGNSTAVIIELIYPPSGGKSMLCQQASTRKFVLRHGGHSYSVAPEGYNGKVFIESLTSVPFNFTNVNAWARDLNTELGGDNKPNVVNDNSKVWILGQKTEDYATKIKTINGGYTELLGGVFRQNWDAADNVSLLFENNPLFVIDNAYATFTFKTIKNGGGAPNYKYLVRETRGTETRNIINTEHGGTYDENHSLYVGYGAGVTGLLSPGIHTEENEITLYPNPSSGKIIINLAELKQKAESAEVYNSLGEKVKEISEIHSSTFPIDLSSLNPGLYILKIKSEGSVLTVRVILTR